MRNKIRFSNELFRKLPIRNFCLNYRVQKLKKAGCPSAALFFIDQAKKAGRSISAVPWLDWPPHPACRLGIIPEASGLLQIQGELFRGRTYRGDDRLFMSHIVESGLGHGRADRRGNLPIRRKNRRGEADAV